MQSNNYLREFSADVANDNFIADGDLKTSTLISNGAGLNAVAKSNLYNTLSRLTTKACASLIDLVAQENPSVQFNQGTAIETWISAVENAIATKKSVDNIVNGTTQAKIASKIAYTNVLPTADNPDSNTLIIYIGTDEPTQFYNGYLYLWTY